MINQLKSIYYLKKCSDKIKDKETLFIERFILFLFYVGYFHAFVYYSHLDFVEHEYQCFLVSVLMIVNYRVSKLENDYTSYLKISDFKLYLIRASELYTYCTLMITGFLTLTIIMRRQDFDLEKDVYAVLVTFIVTNFLVPLFLRRGDFYKNFFLNTIFYIPIIFVLRYVIEITNHNFMYVTLCLLAIFVYTFAVSSILGMRIKT